MNKLSFKQMNEYQDINFDIHVKNLDRDISEAKFFDKEYSHKEASEYYDTTHDYFVDMYNDISMFANLDIIDIISNKEPEYYAELVGFTSLFKANMFSSVHNGINYDEFVEKEYHFYLDVYDDISPNEYIERKCTITIKGAFSSDLDVITHYRI